MLGVLSLSVRTGESFTKGEKMADAYEKPELVELGLLSMDTLASTGSKGAPANPNGDENDEGDNPAEAGS